MSQRATVGSWRSRARMALLGIVLVLGLPACTLTASDNDETALSGVPVVAIASPVDGTTYADGVSINVQASITNAGEDIDRVVISLNGAEVEAVPAPNPEGLTEFSIARTIASPGIGTHSINVTAFRADDTGGEAAAVNVDVVDGSLVVIPRSVSLDVPDADEADAPAEETPETEEAPADEPEPDDAPADDAPSDGDEDDTPAEEPAAPTDEPEPTNTPLPSNTPEPTAVPATATPAVPTAVSTTNINVRSGPSTVFEPPIGAFRPGDRAEILATNLNGTWLKIRRGQTGEGWVLASLVTIEGSITGLPSEAGPPTPLPPTNTPIPATATPSVTNNLVPVSPFIDPPQPQCGQPFTAGFTIRNDGSAQSNTGLARIQVVRASDGQVLGSSENQLVSVTLPSGGTHTVAAEFNINVFVNEEHRVQFIVDVNGQVAETIEDDNQIGISYTLPPCN